MLPFYLWLASLVRGLTSDPEWNKVLTYLPRHLGSPGQRCGNLCHRACCSSGSRVTPWTVWQPSTGAGEWKNKKNSVPVRGVDLGRVDINRRANPHGVGAQTGRREPWVMATFQKLLRNIKKKRSLTNLIWSERPTLQIVKYGENPYK